jgi:shikimate kinase / 3-dehydroquinate synthase
MGDRLVGTDDSGGPDVRSVVLVGFMGAGKSKAGVLVAEELGRQFVDTDELIEEQAGRSIAEVFENDGEAAFRRMETDAIESVLRSTDNVIALGGGAAARQGNWDLLARSGALTVYLRASVDTIMERVSGKTHRPLLAGLDEAAMRDKISGMLAEREPWYLKADLVIDSDNRLDKLAAAKQVAARLRAAGIS